MHVAISQDLLLNCQSLSYQVTLPLPAVAMVETLSTAVKWTQQLMNLRRANQTYVFIKHMIVLYITSKCTGLYLSLMI